MKQPKKLNYHQKAKLSKKGYDASQFMLLTEDTNTFTVISKEPDQDGNKTQITFQK